MLQDLVQITNEDATKTYQSCCFAQKQLKIDTIEPQKHYKSVENNQINVIKHTNKQKLKHNADLVILY